MSSVLGTAVASRTLCKAGGINPSSPAALPPDLLIEVLSRCDHDTLVRCAVSSKLLCRSMRDNPDAFLLRRRPSSGFAPSLFLGVFAGTTRFVESPSPPVISREPIRSFLSDKARFLGTFHDLSACGGGGGLVVFRRRMSYSSVDLCVCDPMTGHYCLLRSPLVDDSWAISILDNGENNAGGAGSSSPFQLLAARMVFVGSRPELRSHLFSSRRSLADPVRPGGSWSPVRKAVLTRYMYSNLAEQHPVVIGHVAHWLLSDDVVALRADYGRAELITGPIRKTVGSPTLLVSTADGRLSMVVADHRSISMLVLSSEVSKNCWELHATIVREGILGPDRPMSLKCFGQRSGTVVLHVEGTMGLVLLNLETMEVANLPAVNLSWPWACQVYETDLPSLVATLLDDPPPSS